MVVHMLNRSYFRGRGSRISVPGWPGQNQETLQETQTKAKIAVGIA